MSDVLQSLLGTIAAGATLSREESRLAMHAMMRGEADPEIIAGFLLGLRSRRETIDELVGFTEVMREYAVPVQLSDHDAIDLCGTGGDGSGTFNISTAAAFVCAGAGVTVAKHGNRSISSKCGSSDVLQFLGVQTELHAKGVEYCLDKAGIAFIFAPLFHPALKHVMPVRRKLGVRTFFNILGPLCNPANVRRQLVGAFSTEVAQSMAAILQELGSEKVVCVCSDDGLDEFSLSSSSTFFCFDTTDGRGVREQSISPEELGITSAPLGHLSGGDAAANATIITSILSGDGGPRRDIVVLNAAFALTTAGQFDSIQEAIAVAGQSIDSGAARRSLDNLVSASSTAPTS